MVNKKQGNDNLNEQSITEDEKVTKMPVDNSEELFEDGPTTNQVEKWKSQFGSVYMTELDDDVFIWRTITRVEYKGVLKAKNADALYREERICELCVLWPKDYNFLAMGSGKAGIPSLLSEQIMDKSGFAQTESRKL